MKRTILAMALLSAFGLGVTACADRTPNQDNGSRTQPTPSTSGGQSNSGSSMDSGTTGQGTTGSSGGGMSDPGTGTSGQTGAGTGNSEPGSATGDTSGTTEGTRDRPRGSTSQ
jgi:hypothetical protein